MHGNWDWLKYLMLLFNYWWAVLLVVSIIVFAIWWTQK